MKTAILISRVLLGLIFTVFGLNGFLHFIPMPAPTGLAGQFMGALFVSHYLIPIFAFQLAGGVLLLSGRYTPLALTLLAPIIVNIDLYHALMAPEGLPLASVVTVLWAVTFFGVRASFAGIFEQKSAAIHAEGQRQERQAAL